MNNTVLFSHPKLAEKIVEISYAVYAFITTIQFTQIRYFSWFSPLFRVVEVLLILSIAVSILIGKRFDRKQFIIAALFLLLGIVVMIQTNRQAEIILLFGFILAGYEMNSDHFLQYYIGAIVAACALTELLLLLGIVSPINSLSEYGDPNRLTLGFNYHSYLPNHFFHAVLAYFALKKKDINLKETVVILSLNCVLYYFTKTSAAFLCVLVMIFLMWVLKLSSPNLKSKVSNLFIYSTVLFCGLSYALALLWKPEKKILSILNSFLHGRLELGHQGLLKIGISLFGRDYWFNQTSGVYDYVDSSFLHIAIIYGIVVLILLILGFTILTKKAANAKRYAFCAAIFVLMLHSSVEPQLLDLSYDPFLLMLGATMLGVNLFSSAVPQHGDE